MGFNGIIINFEQKTCFSSAASHSQNI